MKNLKRGFTLIEMLIVVVIIGILAAALIPRLQSVQGRARDTKVKADLQQIGAAAAIFKGDLGSYTGMTLQGLAPQYLTAVPSNSQSRIIPGEFGTSGTGGYGLKIFCPNSQCILLGGQTEIAGSSNATSGNVAALNTTNSTISSGMALISTNPITIPNGTPSLRYYYVQ